jgi:hypothetical protein
MVGISGRRVKKAEKSAECKVKRERRQRWDAGSARNGENSQKTGDDRK